MTGLTDLIRIETATFPVHQVSHKIPLMLEFSQMVRVIRLAPLPFSFPSRRLACLMLLVNQGTRGRVTMALDRGGAC